MEPSSKDASEKAEETRMFLARNRPPAKVHSITFNIEILRCFALVAITLLFATGKLFQRCIFKDVDDVYPTSSRLLLRGVADNMSDAATDFANVTDTGISRSLLDPTTFLNFNLFGHPFCEPYLKMSETYIFQKFGFPHTCSFIDFNPFAEIFAILLPLYSLPMLLFLFLNYYRIKLSVMNGEVPQWLFTYTKITTPYMILATTLTHLWFVNNPEMKYPYGYGFWGHYIPYVAFQICMSLVAIGQLHYYIGLGKMPFGAPVWLGKLYVRVFVLLMLICQVLTMSILLDKPILDSAKGGLNGTWERDVFRMLADVYVALTLPIPILLSFHEIHNGDTNTFTIAHQ